MIELSRLPPLERIERYRKLAEDARGLAQCCASPEQQRLCLCLADLWEALAIDTKAKFHISKDTS